MKVVFSWSICRSALSAAAALSACAAASPGEVAREAHLLRGGVARLYRLALLFYGT